MLAARYLVTAFLTLALVSCERTKELTDSIFGCVDELSTGARPFAATREARFLGKVV